MLLGRSQEIVAAVRAGELAIDVYDHAGVSGTGAGGVAGKDSLARRRDDLRFLTSEESKRHEDVLANHA